MCKFAQLFARGSNHCLVCVPDGGDTDACAHVNELITVYVDQNRAVCSVNVDGQHTVSAPRHNSLSSSMQFAALRAGNLGDEEGLLRDDCIGTHDSSLPLAVAVSGESNRNTVADHGHGSTLVAWLKSTNTR